MKYIIEFKKISIGDYFQLENGGCIKISKTEFCDFNFIIKKASNKLNVLWNPLHLVVKGYVR